MVRNFYYYSFYFLAESIRKVNKNNKDYLFSGVAFLSMLMMLNTFTIIYLIFRYNVKAINPYLLSLCIAIPLLGLNYYFLLRNNRGKEIVELCKKNKTLIKTYYLNLVMFILYVVVTFASTGYIAYLIRHHLL